MVREDVIGVFGICKDIEYLLLRYLLDDLVPLVFYFYATIHKGSRYELWQKATLRLAIMFIGQQRHNYNKAMLATLSDHLYHEMIIPEYKSTFSSYMNIFSGKKVETFHSLLRMQCPSWTSAEQITEIANVLGASSFDHEFTLNFLSEHPKKSHKHNVELLAGRAAEFLTNKLIKLYNQPGQSKETTGSRQRRRNFQLNTFSCTLDQRSLPLGFSTPKLPNADLLCDLESCTSENEDVILLSCGHSLHSTCTKDESCVYCQPFLLDSIKKLSEAFNKSIAKDHHDADEGHVQEEDDDGEEDFEDREEDWYTTTEFQQHLKASFRNLPPSAVRPEYISALQKEKRRETVLCDHSYAGN